MFKYRDIEKYIADMFTHLIGQEGSEFGFDLNDVTNWVIVERQNSTPMPDVNTVLTFRIDRFNYWGPQRFNSSRVKYDEYGGEILSELKTFAVCVNVMSKGLGDAFDTSRFIVANLQNGRYTTFIEQKGRLLGIENVSVLTNLSGLENGTWTERVYFEIQMNMLDKIVLSNQNTLFVKTPETRGDLAQSVAVEINTTK